jgi:hypothetical protein
MYEPWYAPAVLAQIVLIVVGVAYTAVSWRQLRAIRRQGEIAQKSLDFSREPYIVPTDFRLNLTCPDNESLCYSVSYCFINYGPGPALVEHAAVICQLAESLKQPPAYSGALLEWTSVGQILESKESTGKLDADSKPVPRGSETWNAMSDGTFLKQPRSEQIFFYGEVFYDDLAGNGYVTGFAALWDYERGRMRLATAQEAPGYNYRYGSRRVKRPPFWQRWRSRTRLWGPVN